MIPIRLTPVRRHIRADRRLAFEVVTAFSAGRSDDGPRVLERYEDGSLLVEFNSTVPTLRGTPKQYRTVERVRLTPPEQVDFEGVEGPLALLRDRFTFEDRDGCTEFTYSSTFGLRGGPFGWVLGELYVRRRLSRFMREHVSKLRATIEDRASRSHVYPMQCTHDGPTALKA